MPFEKDPDEIGVLWINEKGHMSGTINGVKVVCFRVRKKTSDKSPDWRVLKSVRKDERATPSPITGPTHMVDVTDDDFLR